jgi:hypothetical protein
MNYETFAEIYQNQLTPKQRKVLVAPQPRIICGTLLANLVPHLKLSLTIKKN